MTISFLPREHNMKAVNELKTDSERLVSSIFREWAFKNISLLIEFWYRNRERGRRRERCAANRVVVKWVEKWVRSKAVKYRLGEMSDWVTVLETNRLPYSETYTHVQRPPRLHMFSDQINIFMFPYGYGSYVNEDMIRNWGRNMIKKPASDLFIVMMTWSECKSGRQQYRISHLFWLFM